MEVLANSKSFWDGDGIFTVRSRSSRGHFTVRSRLSHGLVTDKRLASESNRLHVIKC